MLHRTEKKEVLSDFYSIMGDIYHTKKQMADAYNAYDSALVYNPSNIGALNNYAYYLSVERRDLDKAEEMSYKTVKAEPDNATFLIRMPGYCLKMGITPRRVSTSIMR